MAESTKLTFNSELAHEVLDQIKAHPEHWDQAYWVTALDSATGKTVREISYCDTAMCFAGWAVTLTDKPEVSNLKFDTPWELYAGTHAAGYIVNLSPNGEYKMVRYSTRAAELLGLEEFDADILFRYNNTIEDLTWIVDKFDQGLFISDGTLTSLWYEYTAVSNESLDGCTCTDCRRTRERIAEQQTQVEVPEEVRAVLRGE